jgi:hypothetical protein
MFCEYLRICLLGWPIQGRILGGKLFDLLGLELDAGFYVRHATVESQAAEITLVRALCEPKTHETAPEAVRDFAATVATGLRRATEWLQSRPCSAFEKCRAAGIRLEIFVSHWAIDGEFRLELPAEFLRECGRADLPIRLSGNED